jgi:Tol biopolymer transport system component
LAYIAQDKNRQFVVVDGEEGWQYSSVGAVTFSPDSKRVAYTVNNQFVIVDGIEGVRYDTIVTDSPTFSPDSQRVAYVAEADNKQFVVVDGMEGKQYDSIVIPNGGNISFDSPDSFHYLACEGDIVYLVEESIE